MGTNVVCKPPESIYCGKHECPTCRGPFWKEYQSRGDG